MKEEPIFFILLLQSKNSTVNIFTVYEIRNKITNILATSPISSFGLLSIIRISRNVHAYENNFKETLTIVPLDSLNKYLKTISKICCITA